jgi:hypothetical protein
MGTEVQLVTYVQYRSRPPAYLWRLSKQWRRVPPPAAAGRGALHMVHIAAHGAHVHPGSEWGGQVISLAKIPF